MVCGMRSYKPESKRWKSMKPYGRQTLLKELLRRRSDMKKRSSPGGA